MTTRFSLFNILIYCKLYIFIENQDKKIREWRENWPVVINANIIMALHFLIEITYGYNGRYLTNKACAHHGNAVHLAG